MAKVLSDAWISDMLMIQGRGGSTLKSLRVKTGTRIDINKTRDTVMIKGTKDKVENAANAIDEMIYKVHHPLVVIGSSSNKSLISTRNALDQHISYHFQSHQHTQHASLKSFDPPFYHLHSSVMVLTNPSLSIQPIFILHSVCLSLCIKMISRKQYDFSSKNVPRLYEKLCKVIGI